MPQTDTHMRVAGAWLGAGGLLLATALVFHGPPAVDVTDQMQIVAGGAGRWATVHWIAAAALSLFAVAGLVVLSAGSRLTGDWWTMSAWAVLPVGALWTMTTAVAEATAVTAAAVSGNVAMFESWWAFSEGKANGFAALALAIVLVARNEARASDRVMPVWASWTGVVVAAGSFLGWVLGSWLGIGAGGPIWLLSSLVMCLWLLWFGVALMRTAGGKS